MHRGEIILGEKPIQTNISKTYKLKFTKLLIEYDIAFSEPIESENLLFSPEINVIGVSYPYKTTGTINRKQFDLAKLINHSDCRTIEVKDLNELERVSIVIKFTKAIDCVIYPLFSIPKSEIGFEETYQGTSIFPKMQVSGKNIRFNMEIILKSYYRENNY